MLLAAGLIAASLTAACWSRPLPDPGQETSPPPTATTTSKPADDDSLAAPERGLPGGPGERLAVALAAPDNWNLNPFRSGERLFPVDPQGYYQPLYQTLIQYDPQELTYVPVLAETMHYKEGVLVLTISPGRKWHDGFPVTSADVLFSIQANQKFETAAGKSLQDLVEAIELKDENSLEIQVKADRTNPGLQVMEALSQLLILPRHSWNTLVSSSETEDQLSAHKLPMIGSGPWALWGEDEFALSLTLAPGMVAAPGQPVYLSILKYARPHLAKEAFLRGDFDLMLGPLPPGLLDEEESAGSREDRLLILGGEKLAGITINPSGGGLLYSRPFRRLLSLLSSQPDAMLIPSTGSQLKGDYRVFLLDYKEETVSRLTRQAGLSTEQGTFFLQDGEPLPPIRLTYPAQLPGAGEYCRAFEESARELGIPLDLESVSLEDWKQACDTGDYALIYTESSLDESIIALAARLARIPGVKGSQKQSTAMEFQGAAAYEIMVFLEDAWLAGELEAVADQLVGWLVREAVFIPLAAENVRGGFLNQREGFVIDLPSLFAGRTQRVPAGHKP